MTRRIAAILGLVLMAFFANAASALAADPTIAAAGDIACDPSDSSFHGGAGSPTNCRQRYASDIMVNAGLSAVLPLGDLQYNSASLSAFRTAYDPSWGRVKPVSRPALGNHEPGNATGYFDYFNGPGVKTGPAGERGKGYYSFDVGTWHLIALNSNCSRVPCAAGSAQEKWLEADLAAHPTACALAYWHHPRFSSGYDGNNTFMQPLWQDLYDAGVEIALSGHSHDYERFAPQDANGKLDGTAGIRQFVVGTGGAFFTGLGTAKANSEVRQNNTYGVLVLTLHPSSYDWRFVPEAGKSFTDSGTANCQGQGPPGLPPPPAPLPAPRPLVVSLRTGAAATAASKRTVTCTIAGTPGPDKLSGTPGDDVMCGLGGNDRIRGRDGNDILVGGAGKDFLAGGRGNDRLYGNVRRDVLRGQSGNDRLIGGSGPDHIWGNVGNDVLIATFDKHGGDFLFGGRGRDRAVSDVGDHVSSVERLTRRRN
jgi:Ca2+-binding RTX toxin-like protein